MPMNKPDKKTTIGLTSAEVNERIANALVNGEIDVKTKSYKQIVKDNALTLFNLVNVILLVCILLVGSLKNALFFIVVICNFGIGVVQEIRAKKTIEKLSLLSAPKATVLRDGVLSQINIKDIVLGEIIQLKNGSQICADGVIIDGECQVNESFITGETTPITKKVGDSLLSGSFLVSGKVLAETEHIGKDNYVSKITLGAKRYKKSTSVIMRSVKMIVRVVAIAMVPLAGLFVWTNFFRVDQGFADAMVRTVAAISAMIPGGLVLLVSMVLAVSVIRLSVHNTLVQDLYCVENLARVDVLCLDKTGTITEGKMSVEDLVPLGDCTEEELQTTVKEFALLMDDENSTLDSIRKYFEITEKDIEQNSNVPKKTVPFSSERKWSLVSLKNEKKTYVLGAPEFVSPNEYEKHKNVIEAYAAKGKRVLFICNSQMTPECKKDGENSYKENLISRDSDHTGNSGYGPFIRAKKDTLENTCEKKLPDNLKALGLIIIGDKIKEDAKKTFKYFADEDVLIKVISGDNPVTVSEVAKEAGIRNADLYVDAEELDTYEKIEDAVEKFTVFGRVSPYQKLDIVKALKAKGHTVAMTGDGANDCLALKEADCSVAMQTGAEAARNVANIVMVDSNFESLPLVLAEGRKSINNLQRSAALYLVKTTYAFLLTIIFVFVTYISYPFENIQITLIGAITIGIPSFFLALEPNNNRIKKNFLFNVFRVALPTGVMTLAGMLATAFFAADRLGLTKGEISTATTYGALIMGIIVVFDICGKLNWWKAALLAFLVAAAIGLVTLFPTLFSLVPLSWSVWKLILIVSAIFFIIHFVIFRIIIPKYDAGQDEKEMKQRYGRGGQI